MKGACLFSHDRLIQQKQETIFCENKYKKNKQVQFGKLGKLGSSLGVDYSIVQGLPGSLLSHFGSITLTS